MFLHKTGVIILTGGLLCSMPLLGASESNSKQKSLDESYGTFESPNSRSKLFVREKKNTHSMKLLKKEAAESIGLDDTDIIPHLELKDNLGWTHAIFKQRLHGLDVVGSRVTLHQDKEGSTYSIQSFTADHKSIKHNNVKLSDIHTKEIFEFHKNDSIQVGPGREVFVIRSIDGVAIHAFEFEVTGNSESGMPVHELAYTDTVTGSIVDIHQLIYNLKNREVHNSAYTPFQGNTVRTEGSAASGVIAADTNYTLLGNVYDFFHSKFGRDSFDNQGAKLISSVNYRLSSYFPYNNAFWNGNQMVYGDGDGVKFSNLAHSLDVTAHELMHGVTERSAALIYANESGALNEAVSDIFGAACEYYTNGVLNDNVWKLGESIYTPATSGDALRYMNNPTQDGVSKDFYPNRGTLTTSTIPSSSSNDNGYVHTNSGIANLAFKLLVTGGTHPRAGSTGLNSSIIPTTNVTGIGMDKAIQIWYRAVTTYLAPGSQFIDARYATSQSASDLYGPSSPEVTSVNIAWDIVGVPAYSNRQPVNISARGYVGTNDNIMVAGFWMKGGTGSKPMLLRGIGPSLNKYGLTGTLVDPIATFNYAGGAVINTNDDWFLAPNAAAIQSTGTALQAFPLDAQGKDSAILTNVTSGGYTLELRGVNQTSGVGMTEVYDADPSAEPHLVNISTRAYIGTGDNILIASFVIQGTGNKYVLIRGIGPQLGVYGVQGVISDPMIELYDSTSTKIRYNDNWSTDEAGNSVAAQVDSIRQKVGAFPLLSNSKDACLLVSLPAGTYSAFLKGVSDAVGAGMIEVYVVD